jgi:methyl acetate hydrolase
MANNLRSACDAVFQSVVKGKDRVPGVVAMITDRSANIYEGAAGERMLGGGQAMTADTAFHLLDHESDHRHGRPAMRRGG